MWMYKDGITREVEDREVSKFKDLGFEEVKDANSKLKLSEDGKSKDGKKSEDKNGSKAQNSADEL